MGLLHLLLFLGTFCIIYAEECKRPTPMEEFSLTKFSGSWYASAFDAHRLTNRYAKAKCVKTHFHTENGETKPNNWNFEVILGKNATVFTKMEGTYVLPDPTIGYMKLSVKGQKLVYEITVTCTDYTTWFAGFVCAEEEAGQLSEFTWREHIYFIYHLGLPNYMTVEGESEDHIAKEYVILSIRDPVKYEEVTSQDIQKCFKDISTKTVKQLEKRDDINCPVHTKY